MSAYYSSRAMERLGERFARLYGSAADRCLKRLAMMIGRYGLEPEARPADRWDQRDRMLIAYPDMVRAEGEKPLATLKRFVDRHLREAFNIIHLLPFFPYSSDEGFSVIHFRSVNPELGDWAAVGGLGEHFRLMFDLVLNHVSRQSSWFREYSLGIAPSRDYFIEAAPDSDLSAVVRPRSTPLLTPISTRPGVRHVWTTFSPDQVDLNFANPDLLFEILDLLLFYVSRGARIIRLDAIAYLWKKPGSSCVNLPETHEIVKIFRDVLELAAPQVLLLTETNLPFAENLSYFGQGDEADLVYQFSLPPLILHALLNGTARHLTRWAADLPDSPPGCTYLNFTASHDGIGVRPLEGVVPEDEVRTLIEEVKRRRGRVSRRRGPDGEERPYELNITFWDALSDPAGESPDRQVARFICSQVIPLVLQGIPAIYFNSLTAAGNDYERAEKTGLARSLNRTRWQEAVLEKRLGEEGVPSAVFRRLTALLALRARCPAFHPDAPQRVHDLGDEFFAVERQSRDGGERVLAVSNVSANKVTVPPSALAGIDLDPARGEDLLKEVVPGKDGLSLPPYGTVWIRWR